MRRAYRSLSQPALFPLTGGLLLLASLYLPWQSATCGSRENPSGAGGTVVGLVNLSDCPTVDGRPSIVGDAAALFALLLVALVIAAWARPSLAGRLPLRQCALFAGYFACAAVAQTRSIAQQLEQVQPGQIEFHYAYGAFLGIAAAILLLLAAAPRRAELAWERSRSQLAALILVLASLAAFVLPWGRFERGVTFLGVAYPAAVVAAALTLCLLIVWWKAHPAVREQRLWLSGAEALFAGAAVSSGFYPSSHAYGAWVGLGIAIALVALALTEGLRVSSVQLPPTLVLATGAVVALFIAALFLPWQSFCYAAGDEAGSYSGRCVSTNGWVDTVGSTAGFLAIALGVVVLAPRRRLVSHVELAAGLGLLVATLGFQLDESHGQNFHNDFGYGSMIGFAAAALLIAATLARLRPRAFDRSRLPARLAPIAASGAYLVVVVLPWWRVLPRNVQSSLFFAPLSWLTIASALIGIHLLGLWARRVTGTLESADDLVLLPLFLLALAALDLILRRDAGLTWGGGVVVGLCVLLALFGRIEQKGGLRGLHIPEIFRIDRI